MEDRTNPSSETSSSTEEDLSPGFHSRFRRFVRRFFRRLRRLRHWLLRFRKSQNDDRDKDPDVSHKPNPGLF